LLLATQAHGGDGYAYRAGQAISRFAAVGAGAANRNPNEIIEKEMTFGERIADSVAGFGGSWTFILTFLSVR